MMDSELDIESYMWFWCPKSNVVAEHIALCGKFLVDSLYFVYNWGTAI